MSGRGVSSSKEITPLRCIFVIFAICTAVTPIVLITSMNAPDSKNVGTHSLSKHTEEPTNPVSNMITAVKNDTVKSKDSQYISEIIKPEVNVTKREISPKISISFTE